MEYKDSRALFEEWTRKNPPKTEDDNAFFSAKIERIQSDTQLDQKSKSAMISYLESLRPAAGTDDQTT